MNKKGFTLTELLAVILILSIILVIGTVSISGLRLRIKQNMFNTKLDLIISEAKNWGEDNMDLLKNDVTLSNGETKEGIRLRIDRLIDNGNGYLKTDETVSLDKLYGYSCSPEKTYGKECKYVITDNTSDLIINDVSLYIYKEYNRAYACIINDEYNNTALSDPSGTKYSKYYC